MTDEKNFVGSIAGLAVGDAMGYPAEFRSRDQLLKEIGPDGITDFIALKDPRFTRPFFTGPAHPPGTYTDDTQMTLAVGEALLIAGSSSLDDLMTEMGRRFVDWSTSREAADCGRNVVRNMKEVADGEEMRKFAEQIDTFPAEFQ